MTNIDMVTLQQMILHRSLDWFLVIKQKIQQ